MTQILTPKIASNLRMSTQTVDTVLAEYARLTDPVLSCPKCDKTYKTDKGLANHIKGHK